jgi:hypothetical protein
MGHRAVTVVATSAFCASGAGVLLSPANPNRVQIEIQPAGELYVGVSSTIASSAGQMVPSGARYVVEHPFTVHACGAGGTFLTRLTETYNV